VSSLVTEGTALDPYELASDVVRGYCKQQFDYVVDDVVIIDPRPDRTAQLPEMPVAAVTSVLAYMPGSDMSWGWQTLTSPGQYGFAPDRGLIWDATRIMPPIVPGETPVWPYISWPWLPQSLQVTYTHGYETIPADLQAIVVRLAGQFAQNPTFMQSKKVGENAYVYGTFPGGVMLRDVDKKILDKYAVQEAS
jgi:hypothetical protein